MDTRKIYNATDSKELSAALTECMNEAVEKWWCRLDDNTQKAVQMLGFSRSVISSIMFFADGKLVTHGDFGWEYDAWTTALEGKINMVIRQNEDKYFPSLTDIITYCHRMDEVYNEIEAKIAPLGLSRDIQEAAIQDLVSKDDAYKMYKNSYRELIEDVRKVALWHAVKQIQKGE